MTGADNSDSLYKPSPVFEKWRKEKVDAKRKKVKELPWQHYQHIPIFTTNARLRRSLLGLYLQWTLKEDGQLVTIWKRTKKYCKKKD